MKKRAFSPLSGVHLTIKPLFYNSRKLLNDICDNQTKNIITISKYCGLR